MSNKTKDILDEILDIEETASELVEEKPKDIIVRDDTLDDIDSDYKYQRENFYNLIERGQDAIDGILEVAKQSDHPRSYEVAGNLISQVAEVTEKLSRLQSSMKRLKEVPNNAPKNVTNALYVGSTAELQKLLKGDKGK
jgi:DNA-binding ferritin-like protein|tara:strand:+ start:126 stop:542 length:417 start_codon:yes stop_codon:yes gene_type:complete